MFGPEFGRDCGKKVLIVRDPYGLKSAGAAFGNYLADFIDYLGYKSCLVDLNLWLNPEINPTNNHMYYYMYFYV